MKINKKDFIQKIKENKLKIAFIGMSNIGKSHWSNILEEKESFVRISVDEEIEKMMKKKMFLGNPYEDSFTEKENEITQSVNLFTEKNEGNFIFDTSGSIIYNEEKTLKKLKQKFFIILFDADMNCLDDMILSFFKHPKPVIWKDKFSQKKDETDKDALRRCYPALLSHRINLYRELSDVILDGKITKNPETSFEEFWQHLLEKLD
jgi:shikimate kinase